MGYVGKIIKNGAIMFAMGILLAYAAPTLAGLVGIANPVPTILWNGAFFGGFGAIHAAVEPIINGLLGRSSRSERHTVTHQHVTYQSRSQQLGRGQHHSEALDQDAPDLPETNKFRDLAGQSRSTDSSFQDRLAASDIEATQNRTLH